ncbi:MAG: tRNA 2-selenouridine(34) synthase MnmH [Paracoccaceae bacterium]
MTLEFETLNDLLDHSSDTVIDVRSPAEFAEDHLPGAINLPVLDNDERAEVGTMYVQESPFRARKIGAAKVFRNASHHIETHLQNYEGSWRPLVYCWRGGQRSGSFTWMLQQIGWRAEVLSGGYQTYRRLVYRYLYQDVLPHRLILLDGYTGSAKTDLLLEVANSGGQALDLEDLANHRGSLLGAMADGQPSQKAFESALAGALVKLDPSRPVLVEAESNKIGARIIPPSLWSAMKGAPRIDVSVPFDARCAYLVGAYDDILSDDKRLAARLDLLREYRGHAMVDRWMEQIKQGDKAGLTRSLMHDHYDPAYDKSRRAIGAKLLASVELDGLSTSDVKRAASQLLEILDA